MISTDLQRVQIQDIIEYQLPAFVRDDFPLVGEFLKQYYISQEYPTAPADVIQNIDEYLKLETLIDTVDETILESDIDTFSNTITASTQVATNTFGTYKFPERYGLLKIDEEIILYTSKSRNSFNGCIRGFSGVTSFVEDKDNLTFTTSEAASHTQGAKIVNLSNLLLKQFLIKLKGQIAPGFERRDFDDDINQKLFLSRTKDFYQSKGTDESFRILFAALYGEVAEVVKPKDFLFRPSDAQFRKTRDLVVEKIQGDPLKLKNQTLYQSAYPEYDIDEAFATVIDVEKLTYNSKDYYQVSVDFDYPKDIDLTGGTLLGEFHAHPKTKNLSVVSAGASIIDVDSTIGFPTSGLLRVTGQSGILTYRSKTINQFIGVGAANTSTFGTTVEISSATDLGLNIVAHGFEGIDAVSIASTDAPFVGIATTSRIEVRIGNVLSQNVIDANTSFYQNRDKIKIKSLGITTSNALVSSWFHNVTPKFDVRSILLVDSSDNSYNITTEIKNDLRLGDSVTIIESGGAEKTGDVVDIQNQFTFTIKGQGELNGNTFSARRNVLKPDVSGLNATRYSNIEKTFANVQNSYAKFNGDVLVASSSLPRYNANPLEFYDRIIELDGEFSGELFTITRNHGYYTGDKVYYNSYAEPETSLGLIGLNKYVSKFPEIEAGVFYVKRVNDKQFKIASSLTNLFNNTFVSVSGIVTSNTFTPVDFFDKTLEHQQLVREFKTPVDDGVNRETLPGRTGLLVNGVEILNYKSGSSVYFGSINDVTVAASGEGYDIVNPPVLSIQDSTGVGATGVCNVQGSLQRIDVLTPGFDYVTDPIISITGGNGSGAKASANTKEITHSVSFFATGDNPQIGISSNTIGFTTFHKFRESERVIYKPDAQTVLGGLVSDAEYYVKLVDEHTIKLFNNTNDVVTGSNAIDITSFGDGVHRFESFNKKNVVSNIVVSDGGSGYENKERSTLTGINTALNVVSINNHGYNSGEEVTYSGNADGLSSDQTYIVTVVDDNNFQLSSVGLGTTAKSFYYDTEQYVNITSTGSGTHTFNYPTISVSVTGEIGVSTFSGQDFRATLQPVFRGSIESVHLTDNGVGYGASEVIDFNKQPVFDFLSGRDAELLPIVNNGKVEQVLVTNGGFEYNSPPDLIVNGDGNYCKLTPVISGGQIIDVIVDEGGIGYTDTTTVTVKVGGQNASLIANINQWTVNLFEKYKDIVSSDDGILDAAQNSDFGIQYTHLYAPRELRKMVFGKSQQNVVQYQQEDLQNVEYGASDLSSGGANEEANASFHSPIIGWAYDGNPIYGPYGYTNNNGGAVKSIKSSYKLATRTNRPSFTAFAQGFFVEDFEYDASGDLDEHNGRFCITPDYPEGRYVYFATITDGAVENDGPFENNKIPTFPYIIGNTFKSKPNDFNISITSNQEDYDIAANNWFRNTSPLFLTKDNVSYDGVLEPYKIREESIDITATTVGTIDSVGIVTGGSGYQVGDRIDFEKFDGATSAKAKVSRVAGKVITNVSVASSTISNLEVTPLDSSGRFVAFSTAPHGFTNTDLVTLSGFNTSITISSRYNIGVSTDRFSLLSGVGTAGATGVVTYFSVGGASLSDGLLNIRENDVLGVGSERVKVLNVDALSSRIRVQRAVDGTVSFAHTATTVLQEDSRKFTFISQRENDVDFELNDQIYFDPRETLGIGTLTGTGVGSTIFFSNAGAGITQVFVDNRRLFIPNHGLKSGEVVLYHNGDGDSIVVTADPTGPTTYSIANDTPLYVAKVSDDLIGIQTFKVGIGSVGTFVGVADTTMTSGVLYFTGIGTGTRHSLKTVRDNVVNAEVSKNIVTVATGSTHGLTFGDKVSINVTPGITTTVTVQYNDHNRRIVFNPLGFTTTGVSTSQNTITISDHGLKTGDKVILSASPAPTGLTDQKIYYAYRFSKDSVKLCNDKYQTEQFTPEFAEITIARSGSLLPVNPPVDVLSGNTVIFDLSDTSLSSQNASTLYSAFDLNLYRDAKFTNKFEASGSSKNFEITKTGDVGIDADAKLTLVVTDNVPEELFYEFTPVNLDFISDIKKEIISDKEVVGHNQITKTNSVFSGEYSIIGVGSTSVFKYNVESNPEKAEYIQANATLSYTTDATGAFGGISDINITYRGRGYREIVGVSTVVGIVTGTGAVLEPTSNTIGRVLSANIENIGFDYPTDNTLRPTTNLPEVLFLESLASFDEIGITSSGKNYTIAPNLIVKDSLTGELITDVDLFFEKGDTQVTIRKNTSGLSNIAPEIIPISNSNGIGINDISFNMTTKEVTVGFDTGFSEQSPFAVGDKVLIENVSVGVGSTGSGFNSVDYEYQLFTLTDVNIPIGGNVGVVTFSLSGIINDNLFAGNFDATNSAGRIINQSSFPQFNVKLKKNNFFVGEEVIGGSGKGRVDSWNNRIELLKVSTDKDFQVNELIVGQSSRTQGRVKSKVDFNSEITLEASSVVEKGFQQSTGFLNDNQQRVPDNNYYQNFSYAIKSKIPLQKWDDTVSSLNHTSGFLKFSDLIIESTDTNSTHVFTDTAAEISITIDILPDPVYGGSSGLRGGGGARGGARTGGGISLHCFPAFDLVTENSKTASGTVISDRIFLQNKVLTDYFESVGNRALIIDDISSQFNSEPRTERFSVVNNFDVSQKAKKFLTFVKDKTFTGERQASLVSLIHDGSIGFVQNYGRVDTTTDLGSFDFNIAGSEGQLLFFPTKFSLNNYNVSVASFDIDSGVTGVGTFALGTICDIQSTQVETPDGSATTIVGIASTYRSSKVIVEITADDGTFGFTELSVIHDDTTVDVLEYGDMTTEQGSLLSGLGTFAASMASGTVNIDFTPKTGIACTVNTVRVSLASTQSVGTGHSIITVGNENIARIESFHTSLSSSATPGIHTVATYTNAGSDDYNAAYYLVSVEDTTNDQYQVSELVAVNDSGEVYLSEFGILETTTGIGTIGALFTSTETHLQYTPPASADVQVKVFQKAIQLVDVNANVGGQIDLNNASISAGYGFYNGTSVDVKRAFTLTHRERPIFLRNFDGSDSTVFDLSNNTINLPDHFFVSGEAVNYSLGISTHTQVGIATTTFAGIGATSLLPTTTQVFVIKENNSTIKLASSAENALAQTPVAIDFTSVGLGTFHTLTAEKQNSKCLIALDNYIQNPIVSTGSTTTLLKEIALTETSVTLAGINSVFGGDLIQIAGEIMKVNTVGFGSTNILLVDRGWMGTGITTHPTGIAATVVDGAYNIVGNTINFYTAPIGPTPIGSVTNPPDERDFTGITTHSKFQGRSFMRSGNIDSADDAYKTNHVFDSVADQFNAVTKTFTLKSDEQNVTGFSTNNAAILINGIFQGPTGSLSVDQDYSLSEGSGISSITFTGTATSIAYDANNATIPVGGYIVSVGSTAGLGYQPLVSAGGTAVVSTAGTITSIAIGRTGSGYRANQVVNVGVTTVNTGTPAIEFIGTAAISNGHIVSIAVTNPGSGYVQGSEPIVIFDAPLSYSNIPLVYSDTSAGLGTEATIDIVVGQGSSIIDFEIKNFGYGYGQGQVLTVATGGASGIPTDTNFTFEEFQITVDRIDSDKFSGWHFGELEVLDKFENEFDGVKRQFTIKRNGSPVTIRAAVGSNIDVKATILVFINDILQVPGEAYSFDGGSVISFSEAPNGPNANGTFSGDKCKVLFYKGSGDVDVTFRDVLETIKDGDMLSIRGDQELVPGSIDQDERLVTGIFSSDTVETNPYSGRGIDPNPDHARTVTWCKQTVDKVINGKIISKKRVLNEALINPRTNIIQSVGVGSTQLFVESVIPFFNPDDENQTTKNVQTVSIVSQDNLVGASATAVVSVGNTVESITIGAGGTGYTSAPTITIETPVGLGTTARATATATLTGDTVSSITVSTPGVGYTRTSIPQVLIEAPSVTRETNNTVLYAGDFGDIVGLTSTSVGVASTGFVMQFFIPVDSFLRDTKVVGAAVTLSDIAVGDYFTVRNSNVGSGVTSLYQTGGALGVTTQFLDAVYEVAAVSVAQTAVAGVGITYVKNVTVSVEDLGDISGIGLTEFYGEFSWGKINLGSRSSAVAFNAYTLKGTTGITTGAVVNRIEPLKFIGYSTT